ncbi:MAG: transglycosylase SLT domain-containing protein [Mariprofundus sp.]|nr:transglycosylase SLT domain-containing protein [Mariprofundus sp.]
MRLPVSVIVVLLFWVPVLQAAVADVSTPKTLLQQRIWFQQARVALNKHDMKRFDALKTKLADYPLTPYLDIWQARISLKQGNDALVEKALTQHDSIPESRDLRKAWINELAKRKQWSKISDIFARFPRLAKRLPETAMVTRWYTGHKEEAMQQFSVRWQQNREISRFSKPLHEAWLKQGHPGEAEKWRRIERLTYRGKWKEIHSLSETFAKPQKQALAFWQLVQKDPEKALPQWHVSVPAAPGKLIIHDGIRRIARNDATVAWDVLHRLQPKTRHIKKSFFTEQQRYLALWAARQHRIVAADWLGALPKAYRNEDTRAWQARLYLLQQNWDRVLSVIAAMPVSEQQQSRWIYWKARALAASGKEKQAKALFGKLAGSRGYYSFLSAERLGLPPHFHATDITVSDEVITSLEQRPAVRRAYEWLQLDKRNKAAREWYAALSKSGAEQWQAAVVLASRWGWHDQAIRGASRAHQHDALFERFPVGYEQAVMDAAKETGLMPSSIWSIIRQESAFNEQAVSYVGAKGLMQLMPKTARDVARKLGMGKGMPQLFSPELNIRLGASYLAEQKTRFGNLALASAAYNAGPNRVSQWLSRSPFDAPEAWVEAIPFSETRRYVQQVMAFITVYEWRQKKPSSSLIARLNEQEQKVSMNEAALIGQASSGGGNH